MKLVTFQPKEVLAEIEANGVYCSDDTLKCIVVDEYTCEEIILTIPEMPQVLIEFTVNDIAAAVYTIRKEQVTYVEVLSDSKDNAVNTYLGTRFPRYESLSNYVWKPSEELDMSYGFMFSCLLGEYYEHGGKVSQALWDMLHKYYCRR